MFPISIAPAHSVVVREHVMPRIIELKILKENAYISSNFLKRGTNFLFFTPVDQWANETRSAAE